MSKKETKTATKTAVERPKRVPVGMRNVLAAKKIPGFHTRWVNDTGNRVQVFKDAGYEFVTDKDVNLSQKRTQSTSDLGSPIVESVGGGIKAYLMKIPQEWYDEDQKAKQDRIDQQESDMDPTGQIRGATYGITFNSGK